ncbi:esterase/lipase family protein [Anaerosoma tenue]|uniref:esterase/lipase family protein n=1 Tax=Anaerosoma tenue TaxID=2933588 RepID=UPI002260BE29|nr:alpha/beta fold hydrolase [Anaerosoma tenue]MCK8113906.1 alpha/beta fold hydrolase [Anaerosoma tenue]
MAGRARDSGYAGRQAWTPAPRRRTITVLACTLALTVALTAAFAAPAAVSAADHDTVGDAISSAASSFGVTGLDQSVSDLSGPTHEVQMVYDFLHMWRSGGGASPDVLQEWTAHYSTPSGWPLYICVSRFDPLDSEEAYRLWASRYDDEIRAIYSGFQGEMPSGFSAREVRVGDTKGTEWAFTVPGGIREKTLGWRQGPLVIEVNYGEGASSSGFAELLFNELDSLDLEDASRPESADEPLAPETPTEGLTVGAFPGSFSALGDEVRITIGLSGADAQDAPVSLTGHGRDLHAVTDAGGSASFVVIHDDESVSEYRFRIVAGDRQRDVVIPVLSLRILPEDDPGTGEPYAGVVADGRSTLTLRIELGADTEGVLRVAPPVVGSLEGDGLADDGTLTLQSGAVVLTYAPPPYVTSDHLDTVITPPAPGDTLMSARDARTAYSNGGRIHIATIPLEFTFTGADGRDTTVKHDVLVARPPVMLVHGFTGDASTWSRLHSYLGERGFDGVINEYYAGNQGIHDQAELLGRDIAREKDRYATAGLKIAAVDVVGHSMGGLIAREYVYGLAPHPDDVRKVIMVGTPNHGATFTDKILGNLATEWSGAHSLASEQLYSGSAFMAQINDGEAVGRHLAPGVQYGNIYGVRDDWVVTQSSAWLNGVAERRITGVTHSPAIPVPGTPIAESAQVFDWILAWLGSDIQRAALKDTRVEIVAGRGEVYLAGWGDDGAPTRSEIASFPRSVPAWQDVGTGSDSGARIRLSVAGLAWGSIDLAPDTLITLGNLTPESVTVRVRQGSARFRSLRRAGGGHFEVVVGEGEPGAWTEFHPDAKVIGLDTDFVVLAGATGQGSVEALVLEGRALFDGGSAASGGERVELSVLQAGVTGGKASEVSALAGDQWWADAFYRPSFTEVLGEWWAIIRSQFELWFAALLEGDGAS